MPPTRQTGHCDILALMYRASFSFLARMKYAISIFNYWKVRLTLGLFLDSFKYQGMLLIVSYAATDICLLLVASYVATDTTHIAVDSKIVTCDFVCCVTECEAEQRGEMLVMLFDLLCLMQ